MPAEAVESLQGRAYHAIRQRIVLLSYLPGQKLALKDLCESLEMGRTPVRESLVRLQQEGLVSTVPQSGTYVSRIDLAAIRAARFAREHLEREIVMECCARASHEDIDAIDRAVDRQRRAAASHDEAGFFLSDDLMHQALFDIAGRSRVWAWLDMIGADLKRYRRLRVSTSGLAWDTILADHEAIRNAIAQRDPAEARHLVERHLHMMLSDQVQVLAEYPDYFEGEAE